MKKYLAIIATLVLLIPVLFGGVYPPSETMAQEPESTANKVSGLLELQVNAKLANLGDTPLAEGKLNLFLPQQESGEVASLTKQQIFIHLEQAPSFAQIEELESLGLTLYPETWIPPLKNHPTGFLIAEMPLDALEALAGKNYIAKLETAEQYHQPHNDQGTEKINVDDVWGLGYNGTGVTIAVLVGIMPYLFQA